ACDPSAPADRVIALETGIGPRPDVEEPSLTDHDADVPRLAGDPQQNHGGWTGISNRTPQAALAREGREQAAGDQRGDFSALERVGVVAGVGGDRHAELFSQHEPNQPVAVASGALAAMRLEGNPDVLKRPAGRAAGTHVLRNTPGIVAGVTRSPGNGSARIASKVSVPL